MSEPYEPSIADVLVVKAMLTKGICKSLPRELVDLVLDYAEYWPHMTVHESFNNQCVARGRSNRENRLILRTPPIGLKIPNWSTNANDTVFRPAPKDQTYSPETFQPFRVSPDPMLLRPCRRIVFTIRSHDQGWGGQFEDRGTFHGSWTWFEVGLERFVKPECGEGPEEGEKPTLRPDHLGTVLPLVEPDGEENGKRKYKPKHPLLPTPAATIQVNRVAEREYAEHKVVWSWDDYLDDNDTEAKAKLKENGRGSETGNGEFVRNLQLGDVITVWAKARFPGWENWIDWAKVDIYFAV